VQPAAQPRPRNGSGWKILAIILLVLLPVLLLLNPLHMMTAALGGDGATLPMQRVIGPRLQEAWLEHSGSRNKIAVIKVEGVITGQTLGHGGYSMVDVIEEQFERAAKDDHVKAVVLKVNSPGGEVLASDDIYKVIQGFQEKTGKPVVADMGSLAASGGYYVSAPCQWIVANELTITGSIGVIMHGYNWRGLMDKVGVRPEVFKSGRFKDMLSPDKRPEEITAEEREMIQSMVNETFDKFKSIVREGRAFAAKQNKAGDTGKALAENWEQYADGRILSGKEAQRLGFVDEIGDYKASVRRARKLANITESDVITYHQPFDFADLFNIFGQAESRTVKIDLGIDAPKLQLGRLYFLCPLVLPR
jgi:protease-4